ncbi:MAG: heavy metal transporter [Betaproteobacteria bacterium RIFCSPLOWO2_02_FULL_62_79]|nr:MAG: heavy metal transporter [Betaproteobacteria bacterium RIFCSPLOWO2_02_FULL_62_79]
METTTLRIKGMTCMGCVASVKRVLQGIEGVKAVDVSLEQGQATLQYDSAVANPARFKTAVEEAGYEVP